MTIYLGSDHRGFKLKESLKEHLKSQGHEVFDCGNQIYDENDDYVDFSLEVSRKVSQYPEAKGIVICGSGVGVSIVANKIKGVRCALGFLSEQIDSAKKHDDPNVLALASDFVSDEEAKNIISVWLSSKFDEGENHKRRIEKIDGLTV